MNRIQQIICKTNIQRLFMPQCKEKCKMKSSGDLIGPADPISNLPYIKYAIRENETPAEKELRKHREELQEWNKQFWKKHNSNFVLQKKNFQESELSKKGANDQMLSADEISIFYKDFLDKNWKTHVNVLKMFKKGS